MADSFTPNLNLCKPEVGAATNTWGGVVGLNGDMDIIDALVTPDGTGTSVGINVGVGKVARLGGTLNVLAGGIINAILGTLNVATTMLFLKDTADPTKVVKFSATGLTTATTRTLSVPDADLVIVGTTTTQPLTNKTLTDCDANTRTYGDNSTKLATTAYADAAVASAWTTGDVKLTLKSVADAGWLMMADQTIGSATSGAAYANAAAQALFLLLWNNVSDTYAPVVTGRGANAAADWAANKRITMTKVLGRAFAAAGAGATLTARTLGQTLGEENHALTSGENGPHTHAVPANVPAGNDITGGGAVTYAAGLVNNGASGVAGLGTPHNVMQPTSFFNVMVRL